MSPRRRRGRSRWVLVLGALVLGLTGWVTWEAWHWPDVAVLARRNPGTTAFIDRYRAHERQAGREPRVAWTWVPYAVISPNLKRAVLVAEDITFFSHRGFDPAEMRNAMDRAIEEHAPPRGASTITQQLAKNLWLSPSRNPVRKLEEGILTWQLERRLGKRRILELYLNVVEFGPGVYGAEAASRRYFGKPASELTEDEAAQLAASLPSPSVWHPGVTTRAYHRYVASIRHRMDRAEFLGRLI
jgi:monofunctional biosynthetic peptidoglycan transglycosylase